MLSWLKKLLSTLWRLLKKIWPLLLIAAIVIFFANPALFTMMTSWCGAGLSAVWSGMATAWEWWTGLFTGLGFWESAALVAGTAFLLDPEWTAETISDIGSSIGSAVGSVTEGVVGGVATGLSSSGIMWWLLGGVALYALLSSDDSESERPENRNTQSPLPAQGVAYGN